MTEVIYKISMSLDGYISTPDGGFQWLSRVKMEGEDYGLSEFYRSIDAVLIGSRTYKKTLLSFDEWPYPGKPCWLFSQKLINASQSEVTITTKDPVQQMEELDRLGIKRAWLVGGGALASSFRSQGLITEYVVSIVPVILGKGIPLFASPGAKADLKLVDSKSYPSGLVQLRYLQEKI